MEDGPDTHDVPGHDRATGIDDPVPDREYGDQDHRPEDEVDPAEDDRYTMEDEYAVDEVGGYGSSKHYGTYCAFDFAQAAEQAQDEHPALDLGLVHVTHLETGETQHVELEPTGQDPDGTVDVATDTVELEGEIGTLEPDVDEEEMERVNDSLEDWITTLELNAFLETYDYLWAEYPVDDGEDVVYVVPDAERSFTNKEELAYFIHQLEQYPKQVSVRAQVQCRFDLMLASPDSDPETAANDQVASAIESVGVTVDGVNVIDVEDVPKYPESEQADVEDPIPDIGDTIRFILPGDGVERDGVVKTVRGFDGDIEIEVETADKNNQTYVSPEHITSVQPADDADTPDHEVFN